jgi:hypothetical protein
VRSVLIPGAVIFEDRLSVPLGAETKEIRMLWVESPVMQETAKQLLARGCSPVKMLLGENGPVRLAVIVSRDPGPTGKELHASISAYTGGVRRAVTKSEVQIVAEQLGLNIWIDTVSGDEMTHHMWVKV